MNPNEFFEFTRKVMTVVGTWPLQNRDQNLQVLYSIYSKLIQASIIITTFLMWVNVPLTLVKNIHFGTQIMGVATIYTIMIAKAIILQSTTVRKLIKETMDNKNFAEFDHIVTIRMFYKQSVRNIRWISMIIICLAFMVTLLNQVVCYDITIKREKAFALLNRTDPHRPFPYPMWLPFDDQRYYGYVFGFNIFVGVCVVLYYTFGQIFFISVFYYIVNQMKILQFRFKHLFDRDGNGTASELRNLINSYNEIIKYVEDLNRGIQYVILLEFLANSVHLAFSVFQIRTVHSTLMIVFEMNSIFATAVPFVSMYWLATYIQEESVAITQAIFESKWYEQDLKIKKALYIIMIRSVKPITFSVGPFAKMSTVSVVKVFRTAMSYAAFLSQQSRD